MCPEISPSAAPPSYVVTCREEKVVTQAAGENTNGKGFFSPFLSYVDILFSASNRIKHFHYLLKNETIIQFQYD